MNSFSIVLLPKSDHGDRFGRITIGDFSERFVVAALTPVGEVSSLPSLWDCELLHLVSGARAVALQTQSSRAWVLYRDGDKVHVQDQLLIAGWPGRLNSDGEVVELPVRTTRSGDGSPISEWHTSVEAIRLFLKSGQDRESP